MTELTLTVLRGYYCFPGHVRAAVPVIASGHDPPQAVRPHPGQQEALVVRCRGQTHQKRPRGKQR